MARRLSDDDLREVVELMEDAFRQGYSPSEGGQNKAVQFVAETMRKRGLAAPRIAVYDRLEAAKDRLGISPDETLYRPRQYQHRAPGAPNIPSQSHIEEPLPQGEPLRVLFIGDAHDSPHLPDKSRFRWIGQYAAEHGFDRIVSVGDWWTMDCFSTHTDRATFRGRAKPTFEQDQESFHESQAAFHSGLEGLKPKLDITLGNHEERAWRWDDLHPEAVPHSLKVTEAFAQWGWRTTLYGEFRFFGGVGVTHVPLNGLSRPLAQTQRVNKAMSDTVHGDDHRALMLTDHKSGPFRSPTLYSAGTALPPGFIEGFASKGGSTWRTGVCPAILWGGHVRKWCFEEMILLKARYGRSGEGESRTVRGWAA